MLRDFGVKGVKVQEVVSLDDELLAFLPCVYLRNCLGDLMLRTFPAGQSMVSSSYTVGVKTTLNSRKLHVQRECGLRTK